MATRQGRLNESFSGLLTAATEKLFVLVTNGDTSKRLVITHLNYGYNETLGAPAAVGSGAIHVIERLARETIEITNFSARGVNSFEGDAAYVYFSATNVYGSTVIDFATPIECSPGADVAIIVAPAIDAGGGLFANQRAFLTAMGRFEKVEDYKFGDFELR